MATAKVELPAVTGKVSEADVEAASGIQAALTQQLGYVVRTRKSGNRELDAAWPSKSRSKTGSGKPDFFLFTDANDAYPAVVWENKGTDPGVDAALAEARGYVEGAHAKYPGKPGLPRIAAGYDGAHIKASYLGPGRKWVPLKVDGNPVGLDFPPAADLARGVHIDGNVIAPPEALDASTLRRVLDQLKTVYRNIPALSSGRRPIDFTVALLTLRMIVERKGNWGSWSEQPSLVTDQTSLDEQIGDRFAILTQRVTSDDYLRSSYGSIFKFAEGDDSSNEVAFDFEAVLRQIPRGRGYFERMFTLIGSLPTLHGAGIDIFGEVYQAIGDDSVRRALGEYFTGRHIVAGTVPVFFARAGVDSFDTGLRNKSVADIACGTGGFLTETLRFAAGKFGLVDDSLVTFAQSSFYGFDLSASNASRARVNMYFAGDGFSVINGGVDTLSPSATNGPGTRQFDFILTNPPYGSSSEHHLVHEAFLDRVIDLLSPGGWALIVLPTGTLENPRSAATRLSLLKRASVTDVIALPQHAFAPYTKQRTGIVVLRRRPSDLTATTWEDLLSAIGDEKVSLFQVVHDGFANSDKRFPTRRTAADGSWLHDDLSGWTDKKGNARYSVLYDALINEQAPKYGARRYGRFSVTQLHEAMQRRGANRGSGLELLPDPFLREDAQGISVSDFLARAAALKRRLRNITAPSERPLLDDLKALLAGTITFDEAVSSSVVLDSILLVTKGNQALTEAVMYNEHQDGGLPVYGGGASPPGYYIRRTAKTAKGADLKVFSGPAIVLSIDGSSGAMRVIEDGDFACNHHAAVLTPRRKRGVYLHLFAQQSESRLKLLASNQSGSATLTVGMVRSLEVSLPTDTALARQLDKVVSELRQIHAALI